MSRTGPEDRPARGHIGAAYPAGASADGAGSLIWQVTSRARPAALPTRTERGYLIADLRGRLDATRVPVLREQLLDLIRPAPSRLILDLSQVSHIDVGALAVLVGTERRARQLGGSLRLAAALPAVTTAVLTAGLDWVLRIFPTVQSATISPAWARPLTAVAVDAQPWNLNAGRDKPPVRA
jgi:anti-anti-sigma factor